MSSALVPEEMIKATLPDNDSHTCRMEILSETSDRVYIVAKSRRTGKWECKCPAGIFHRKNGPCKHLKAMAPFLKEMEENEKITG